jgi:hypothetical protein
MSNGNEAPIHRVLRWMTENLEVASSIYRTKARSIAIDPAISLDADANPLRQPNSGPPSDLDDQAWFLNSACGLIACSYMDALGKVYLHGQGGNRLRFESFINEFMLDLVAECDRKGAPYNLATLWTTYRNGFVHQFAAGGALWGRHGRRNDYWFDHQGRPVVNIDQLAAGAIAGIRGFRAWCDQQNANGSASAVQLLGWLGA